MKNLDVGALQAVFEVLQQHYPERLGELWFLNAPFIFWGLWRVVSPFIQQATKDKIKFLSGRDRERMLQQYIPQDVSLLLLKPEANLAIVNCCPLVMQACAPTRGATSAVYSFVRAFSITAKVALSFQAFALFQVHEKHLPREDKTCMHRPSLPTGLKSIVTVIVSVRISTK